MSIYSATRDYKEILEDVHEHMRLKMSAQQDKRKALELQTLLQELKIAAADFNENLTDPVSIELQNQFGELIDMAFRVQSEHHSNSFLPTTLFRRGHKTKTVAEADNIFEEDLAAILTAGEILGGNSDAILSSFLTGTLSTGTRASQGELSFNDESVTDLLKQLAEKTNHRVSTEVRNATGKVDISGKAVTLNYTKTLPIKVERLMELMKDATFSAKSYSSNAWSETSKKDFEAIGLHLGNSNLYKAVTGALSEIQMGYKQQRAFFFRGINTILYNSHGYGNITSTHFSHLRFIYELRGSGLLDENGLILPVKYLIYNDPSSAAIYVKSTASIILEALDSATRGNNLLGDISLSASKVKS